MWLFVISGLLSCRNCQDSDGDYFLLLQFPSSLSAYRTIAMSVDLSDVIRSDVVPRPHLYGYMFIAKVSMH